MGTLEGLRVSSVTHPPSLGDPQFPMDFPGKWDRRHSAGLFATGYLGGPAKRGTSWWFADPGSILPHKLPGQRSTQGIPGPVASHSRGWIFHNGQSTIWGFQFHWGYFGFFSLALTLLVAVIHMQSAPASNLLETLRLFTSHVCSVFSFLFRLCN